LLALASPRYPQITKSELRKLYLEKRRAISPETVAAMSQQIADRFFAAVDLAAVNSVHTFIRIPKFNEIDTSNIYFRLWRDHAAIRTFAPRVDRVTHRMESIEFEYGSELVENEWGIRESRFGPMVEPAAMDIVIVPLLCFDLAGHRVGYGKGFYDRLLRECRADCKKVGLSYFPPTETIDDVHEGDIRLDLFVMPDRIYLPDMLARPIDALSNPPS